MKTTMSATTCATGNLDWTAPSLAQAIRSGACCPRPAGTGSAARSPLAGSASGRVRAGRAKAADPGEQAAEPVARPPHRVDVDAAGEGRRVVAPDGVQQPPERDQPQAEPDEQRQPDGEHAAGYGPHRPGEMLDPAAAADRDRVRRDAQDDALEAEEHRERDDER